MEDNKEQKVQKKPESTVPYEKPAIIYEGNISTRAGTPPYGPVSDPGDSGADPADIFGG